MPRGRLTRGTLVLSVQVQRQHQICASELPHGMAFTLPKEALRALQNALSLHEALPPPHAEYGSCPNLSPASCRTYMEKSVDMVTLPFGVVRLGFVVTMVHADYMERAVLDRGWWLGQLEGTRTTHSPKQPKIFDQTPRHRCDLDDTELVHLKRGCCVRGHLKILKEAAPGVVPIQSDLRF